MTITCTTGIILATGIATVLQKSLNFSKLRLFENLYLPNTYLVNLYQQQHKNHKLTVCLSYDALKRLYKKQKSKV